MLVESGGRTTNTKICPPAIRANLVTRVRLTELITRCVDEKLIVVSAPAGFGKTTLLASLAQHCDRTAWLSLDNRDNDPSRFWLNVVQALRRVSPEIGAETTEMFGSTEPAHLKDGVLMLCQDMASEANSGVNRLVLDDFHLIQNSIIHETLNSLIENLPANWQLQIATRTFPPLKMPAFRARAQVREIGPDQLRFSVHETHQFFEQSELIDLDKDSITAVSERTEGWAAALQLLAISLRDLDDHKNFIRKFAGDNRMIVDYFNAEVLDRQPDTMRYFLMISAISERFCVPLLETLMDEVPDLKFEDAHEILGEIERVNLFIVPLDQKRKWWRYHHLFHDLLQERAERELGPQLQALQRKAAEWFKKNQYHEDALHLFLQLEDYESCTQLIWEAAKSMLPEGRFFQLREWLRLLPDETISRSPQMVLLVSVIAFNSGQPLESRKWLTVLIRRSAENPELEVQEPVLAAELRSMFLYAASWVAMNRNDNREAIENAPKIARLIDSLTAPSAISLTRMNLIHGELLFQCADLPAARVAIKRGINACHESGSGVFAGALYARLAGTFRVAGSLRKMTQTAEEGLSIIGKSRAAGRLEATGYLEQICAEGDMEHYQIDRAFEQLYEVQMRAKRVEHYLLQIISGISLTNVLRCRGQLNDAVLLSENTLNVADKQELKLWFLNGPGTAWARSLLAMDDLPGAVNWVTENGLSAGDNFNYLREYDYLILARVLMAKQQHDSAARLLLHIRLQAELGGRLRVALEAMLLASLAYRAMGESGSAQKQLRDALAIAARENYRRVFLDEGPDLVNQLREYYKTEPDNVFVGKVLEIAPVQRDHITRMTMLGPDVLSKREIEVLQLISNGCSNRDVATKLFLSPHTVKAHTRNIYEKLAVSSRTQAVAKASSLGLIQH